MKEDDKKRKQIEELKTALEESEKRTFTWSKAEDSFRTIEMLAHICLDVAKREVENQRCLRENPEGFKWEHKYGQCAICTDPYNKQDFWYDKYGLKCKTCQDAVDQEIIPGSIAKNRDDWYSVNDLSSAFNIKKKELNKYVKNKFLNERVIRTKENKIHQRLFLLDDNKDTLPPKILIAGKIVQVERNGEQYFTQAEWYEIADARRIELLSEYRIVECFPETFANPISVDRFLSKNISPLFTLNDRFSEWLAQKSL